MTDKDKKAYKRIEDECKLKNKISQLLQKFSKTYDVECVNISITKNEYYGKDERVQPPMYLIDLFWQFDYMGHL